MLATGALKAGRPRGPKARLAAGCILAVVLALGGTVSGAAAASGPQNLEQPELETAGRIAIGSTLACWQGDWEGAGITYTYQWFRDEEPIASGQSYEISPTDEGHWLSCAVTAKDAGGSTEQHSANSNYINPPSTFHGGTISGMALDAGTLAGIDGEKVCAENTHENEPWVCVHTAASGS
jgi:hypothetical protein